MKKIMVLVVVVVSFGARLVWADMERVSVRYHKHKVQTPLESVKQVIQLKVIN